MKHSIRKPIGEDYTCGCGEVFVERSEAYDHKATMDFEAEQATPEYKARQADIDTRTKRISHLGNPVILYCQGYTTSDDAKRYGVNQVTLDKAIEEYRR